MIVTSRSCTLQRGSGRRLLAKRTGRQAVARDFMWIDDAGLRRISTEVIHAADVTDEILTIATAMEDARFATDVWIDWRSFFADLDGSVIPSTGREIALGDKDGSPAKNLIQRHIQKRRMAGPGRGGDPMPRRGPTGGQA